MHKLVPTVTLVLIYRRTVTINVFVFAFPMWRTTNEYLLPWYFERECKRIARIYDGGNSHKLEHLSFYKSSFIDKVIFELCITVDYVLS